MIVQQREIDTNLRIEQLNYEIYREHETLQDHNLAIALPLKDVFS